jgi:hypothetical protein
MLLALVGHLATTQPAFTIVEQSLWFLVGETLFGSGDPALEAVGVEHHFDVGSKLAGKPAFEERRSKPGACVDAPVWQDDFFDGSLRTWNSIGRVSGLLMWPD